ncbi:MFS transporter [Sedimentibacter sp. zth1]|uniref:MFS transporter n=1 Tax=Sedimentibacter sp. zth1 TaxID=2816908 RepID=UPI001A929D6B|nr:MFS transporter [Sedimentibacter sp. zth1]QSX05404.1 MFS transporter [Sedimentibacter sp. zth1]
MKNLLNNRNAIFLWISRTISRFGDALESLALMYLVYDITGSALAMSTVMIFSMIPNLIVSPIAGALVDRYNKKTILFIAELVRTIAIFAIPVLCWLNIIKLWHINLVAVIVSIAESFYEPCYGVTVALTVKKEDLPVLNSVVTLSNNIARCVGYSLAGIIMFSIGKNILFIFDSFTFLLSAIFALFLKINEVVENKNIGVKQIGTDIVSGFKYLKNERILIGFISVFLFMSLLMSPLIEFLPISLKNVFSLNEAWAGILMTLFSIGTVVGSILYPFAYKLGIKFNVVVFISFISIGGLVLISTLIPNKVVVLFMYTVLGIFVSVLNMWTSTGIQQDCNVAYLGRVSSIISIVATATTPLACAVYGFIIDSFGIITIFFATSVCFVLASIVLSTYTRASKIKS